jgi:hypothetical protein
MIGARSWLRLHQLHSGFFARAPRAEVDAHEIRGLNLPSCLCPKRRQQRAAQNGARQERERCKHHRWSFHNLFLLGLRYERLQLK